nr:E3 UFM1-protein ligase 1 homolog [Onthophagus taurus]
MADWEEIKRLAADFQKVQLTSTAQRLSERNCIEIVSWLLQRKMIDLIFTSDGKEYMTPTQLVTDIKNELYINGGRVNLTQLSKVIGVDYNHVSNHINEVLKGHKDIHFVLGQLIDVTYISKIAGEINEKLQQQGQINLSDLTIQYDLPTDFLQNHVLEKNLGKLIFGRQDKNDPKVFFTESFIARSKAKIRGALVGLTRPTAVHAILNHLEISERLFFSLFEQSCSYGHLTSRLTGAQYIPNVYSRSQNEYISNFYKQNNYLEYDLLTKLGISDYKTYLKKFLGQDDVRYLKSCVVSKTILDRLEADIDECISSKSHLDVLNNVPSVFNDQDVQVLLDMVLTPQKSKEVIFLSGYILSKAFIDSLSADCEQVVEVNARCAVESGAYQQYFTDLQVSKGTKGDDVEDVKVDKREERRKKAAGGKSGGGTQGRETKTKSTKKYVRGKSAVNEDVEDEVTGKKKFLEIVSMDDINGLVQSKLEEDGLDELTPYLVEYLYPTLNQKGLETAGNIYKVTISDRTANRRDTHNDLQNRMNALVGDVRLFDKGLKLFPVDVQANLTKYLLKTHCTDVVMKLLKYISMEENLSLLPDNCTNEQRLKFVNELPNDYRNPMLTLLKSLSAQGIEEFLNSVEDALTSCSMILKKIDKKKDRIVILNCKHSLLEQLQVTDDPAIVLHLTLLILFVTITQNIIHTSGRHVSAIYAYLKPHLNDEQNKKLSKYYDLVSVVLNNGDDVDKAKAILQEEIDGIKKIASEFKKIGAADKDKN